MVGLFNTILITNSHLHVATHTYIQVATHIDVAGFYNSSFGCVNVKRKVGMETSISLVHI